MGRSVCVPCEAVEVVYIDHQASEDFEWQDFVEDVRAVVRERYPSFEDEDRWADREERIILENGHAKIVLCEYCGLASVSLVPRHQGDNLWGDEAALAEAWCHRVARGFREHLHSRYPERALTRLGTFSNGESSGFRP